MVQVLKSAQDFELFGGAALAPSGRALKNSKAKAILGRCAIFNPATAVFRFMHEHGILLVSGKEKLYGEYLEKLEQHGERLGGAFKRMMSRLFDQLKDAESAISKHEQEIVALHKNSEVSVRLTTIPGVGVMTATAIVASMGNGTQFRSGRDFAASLGVVPRQCSSGQTERLQGVSKRGNSYLRKLLVQGGQSVVQVAPKAKGPRGDWLRALIARRGKLRAVMAVANKNARLIWKLLTSGESYDCNYGKERAKEISKVAV